MCDIIIRSPPPEGKFQVKLSNNGQLNQKVSELLIQYEAIKKALDQKCKDKDSQKESPAKSEENRKSSEKRHSNDGPSDSYHIQISKGQRKSVTAARIMEGDTTPTIQVTVDVTMPMELQMKSFSPTFQRAMTQREVRINHIKKWRDDYQQLALWLQS